MMRDRRIDDAVQRTLDLPRCFVDTLWWEPDTHVVKIQVRTKHDRFVQLEIPVEHVLRNNGFRIRPGKTLPAKAIPFVAEHVVMVVTTRILGDIMLGKD